MRSRLDAPDACFQIDLTDPIAALRLRTWLAMSLGDAGAIMPGERCRLAPRAADAPPLALTRLPRVEQAIAALR